MLKEISYHLPHTTKEEKHFFMYLSLLLKELSNSQTEKERIILQPTQPNHALPVTSFETADVSAPQLILDTQESIELEVGNLYIRNIDAKQKMRVIEHREKLYKTEKKDNIGNYIEIESDGKTFSLLTIDEFFNRIQTHIVRIDHTGVNIPTALVKLQQWNEFTQKIASVSNLYQYPTGEPWLFILPATIKEHEENITDFPLGREPKFELVYDEYSPIPTIQIDIESDLPRPELERLLPKPYGISFPGVADFFRSVYIDHPWINLAIRFDIRFRSDSPTGSDWDTGKWLVADGKRVM